MDPGRGGAAKKILKWEHLVQPVVPITGRRCATVTVLPGADCNYACHWQRELNACYLAFPTLDALAAYLRPRLHAPALASWGAAPGTKNLLNLFLELSCGDCTLLPSASSPPAALVVRAMHVATVRIRNRRGALLVETRQLMSDGTLRRRRPRPVSEKMRPGETPEAAAARAVREELGERVRVQILGAGGAEPRVEERESASYPGLPARYFLHAVDAELVEGVPEEGEFDTEEGGEGEGHDGGGKAITVKRHYWAWVDDQEDHGDAEPAVAVAGGAGAQ